MPTVALTSSEDVKCSPQGKGPVEPVSPHPVSSGNWYSEGVVRLLSAEKPQVQPLH